MSAKSVAGYSFLFVFLFLLIGVHPGFTLLFFLAIIIAVAYKLNKRKKSKSTRSGTLPKGCAPHTSQQDVTKKDTLIEEAEKIKSDLDELKTKKNILDSKPVKKITQYTEDASPISSSIETSEERRKRLIQETFRKNKSDYSISLDNSETSKKNSFNRHYWRFRSDSSPQTKKLKFKRALEYCEENNLGSKAKLRRLKMKIDRWSVENDRDAEAMIPDYEFLIDLIEEFET